MGQDAFSSADGRQLAIDMLLELRDLGADATAIDRPGQQNIVGHYLRIIREQGAPALEHGFAAVLTDFIAGALDGAAPDPEVYEEEVG